jgi:hypothetical protein
MPSSGPASASAGVGRPGRRFLAATAGATALAAFLVFHGMGQKSLWFDEGVTVGLISTGWRPLWEVLRDSETNMGLYTLLLKLWSGGGDGVVWLRALSGAAVVATTPLLAMIGRRLSGEATGAVAGALFAVNAFAIHYGQEMRSYGLALFLSTLTLYLLCRLLDRPDRPDRLERTGGRTGPGLSVCWGIACAAAVHTHVVAALVVFCEVVAFAAVRRTAAVRALWPGLAAQALLCAPFFWLMHREGSARLSWVPPISPSRIEPTLAELVGAVGAAGSSPLPWLYGAFLAAGLAFRRRSGHWWLVVAAGLGSLFANVLVSASIAPLFLTRYLIVSLPGVVLLAAHGITALPRFVGRGAIQGALLVAIAVFASAADRQFYRTPGTEDFRTAADFVVSRSADRDGIAFFNPAAQAAFAFYAHAGAPRHLVPRIEGDDSLFDAPLPGGTTAEIAAAEAELCYYRRIWVVRNHDRPNTSAAFGDVVSRHGFRLDHTETLPGISVFRYVRSPEGCGSTTPQPRGPASRGPQPRGPKPAGASRSS